MDGPEGNPMQSSTISRNYAETLLILARKTGSEVLWGKNIAALADSIRNDRTLKLFLESPRVAVAVKIDVIKKAFAGQDVDALFVRFLQQLVVNRRQAMIAEIAAEYESMLNAAENRVKARITLTTMPSDEEKATIVSQLSAKLGRAIDPGFSVDPTMLGGIIIRVGDTVMDGSVRRKLALLRRRMVARPSYSNA